MPDGEEYKNSNLELPVLDTKLVLQVGAPFDGYEELFGSDKTALIFNRHYYEAAEIRWENSHLKFVYLFPPRLVCIDKKQYSAFLTVNVFDEEMFIGIVHLFDGIKNPELQYEFMTELNRFMADSASFDVFLMSLRSYRALTFTDHDVIAHIMNKFS